MAEGNVVIWYFIGMLGNDVLHVDHDVFSNDEDGRNQARLRGEDWFNRGVIIDEKVVEFNRVIVVSEYHETVFDARKELPYFKGQLSIISRILSGK